jgi:hypothetical protein
MPFDAMIGVGSLRCSGKDVRSWVFTEGQGGIGEISPSFSQLLLPLDKCTLLWGPRYGVDFWDVSPAELESYQGVWKRSVSLGCLWEIISLQADGRPGLLRADRTHNLIPVSGLKARREVVSLAYGDLGWDLDIAHPADYARHIEGWQRVRWAMRQE